MPKKKVQFIDKSKARHFHLVSRSQDDPLAEDGGAAQRVFKEVPAPGMREEELYRDVDDDLAALVMDEGEARDGAEERDGGAAEMDELDEFGFTKDGYDYSQHMRPSGGGTWIPSDYGRGGEPIVSAAKEPTRVDEVIMRDAKAAPRGGATGDVRARVRRAAPARTRSARVRGLTAPVVPPPPPPPLWGARRPAARTTRTQARCCRWTRTWASSTTTSSRPWRCQPSGCSCAGTGRGGTLTSSSPQQAGTRARAAARSSTATCPTTLWA